MQEDLELKTTGNLMLNYTEKDMCNTFFNVGYLRKQFIIS